MRLELKQVLASRIKEIITPKGRIPAAVLIPMYHSGGGYHIVFIKRTETVSTHKGQYSFPGGASELTDGSMLETALRESQEEIGLRSEDVEVLGELDDQITTTSNFVITSFIGLIPWPYVFTRNEWEVDQIISVPLDFLLDSRNMTPDTETLDGEPIPSYSFNYRGQIIWGATARILYKLLELVRPLAA